MTQQVTAPLKITSPCSFHIPIHDELLQCHAGHAATILSHQSGLSVSRCKRLMLSGAVWLERSRHTQRLRRSKRTLVNGDVLHAYYDAAVLAQTPATATLLLDKTDFSIWDKPRGMLSQGSKWGDHCSISRWSETHLEPQRNALIVHRLDRATRGLILLAHSKQAARLLAAMFKQQHPIKRYRAIVCGDASALITDKGWTTLATALDGKPAVTLARYIDYRADTNVSLLELEIKTGRKHQIRRHLLEAGLPVLGDRLYPGSTEANNNRMELDLQLSAILLAFKSPLNGELIEARLDEDQWPSLAALKKAPPPT